MDGSVGFAGSMLVEEIVQHFNGSGTATDSPTTITYFQGPQGPLYRKASTEDEPHWYVYDGLGSVVGEVDPSGNLTATKLFDVYGGTRGYTGTPTTRQGFVGGLGHETDDETGLVYMRARYYDPSLGRFVSEDPKLEGHNWFIYCGNDPINYADSSGKTKEQLKSFNAFIAEWTGGIGGLALLFAVSAALIKSYAIAEKCAALACAMFVIGLCGAGEAGGVVSGLIHWAGEIGGIVGGGSIVAFFLWFKGAKQLEENSRAAGGFACVAVAGEIAHGIECFAALISMEANGQ